MLCFSKVDLSLVDHFEMELASFGGLWDRVGLFEVMYRDLLFDESNGRVADF